MVNVNPNRESCMEYMKELIRKGLAREEVVDECKKGFEGVHPSTFYDWYKIVIRDQDIKQWEEDNKIQIEDKLNDRRDLKELIYQRNKKKYVDNKDPEDVAKAEKILLTHFLDKIQ